MGHRPGNHDNDQMVRAVAASGARVLDHQADEVAGIRCYGVGDPTFSPGEGYRTDELEALKRRRSVEVVYLDAATRRPIAIDQITVRSRQVEFSVRRLGLPESAAAFTPNPIPVPAPDAPQPGDETTVIEPPSTVPGAATTTTA